MTTPTITIFAYPQLTLAPENARHGQTYDFDGLVTLATSMREMYRQTGRPLVEPLKAYPTDGGAAVWDGGRRRAALGLIADDGDDEGKALLASIPVIMTTQEEARLASLVTFQREDMHPADQFLAWNGLFDAGQTVDQIAAAVGVGERDVARLLRFRALAPRVFEAFKAGHMDFDAALAFTLSDKQERQMAVLDSFGDKLVTAREVRVRIKEGAVQAWDRRAKWVGRAAYAKAGGAFITDLFSGREIDEQWADEGLLQRLFDEKLAKVIVDLEAEGWSKVEARDGSYGWSKGFDRMNPKGTAKKGKPKPFTADQMAKGWAFVLFDYNDVKIERGWTKASKGAALPSGHVPPAKADPARFGFGNRGHYMMTQVANDATKVALVRNPQAAADALLVQLAWSVLRKPQYGGVAGDLASKLVPEGHVTQRLPVEVKGLFEVGCALQEWKERLPTTMVAFCQAVSALTPDEKLALQALCFASTLDAVEAQVGLGRSDRRRNLGWMAAHAGVDVVEAWQPDADFLKGGSKEALLAATKEATGKDGPATAKKGDLVALVEDLAQKGWRPALLRDFMNVSDPEPSKADARDAATEAEYLGWIAEALVASHDVPEDQAEAVAALALAEELGRAGTSFGDSDYRWTRTDARSSAIDYFVAKAEDEEAEG